MATAADRLGGFPRWVTEEYWMETRRSILTAPVHPGALRRAARNTRALLPRLAEFTGRSPDELHAWLGSVRRRRLAQEIRQRCPSASGMGGPAAEVLYLFARAVRPSVLVETGVELGVSSAYFLQALADNGVGELWSIDLPFVGAGHTNADGRFDAAHVNSTGDVGRAVPDRLRSRWHLSLGDARELLPALSPPAPWDLFFHDSEHTRAHMLWEFETAWPRMRPGGYLLSDDIPENDAFSTFANSVGRRPFLWLRRGAVRKPELPPGGPPPAPT